jgi:tetratricopeptide (TPR) repeat protein
MDEALRETADSLLRMGRSDEAATLYCTHGSALQEQGRMEDALGAFNRALTIDPRHAASWNHRGTVLAAMKRYEEALQSYDRALVIRPDFSEAAANRRRLFREAAGNQGLANALCARGALLAEDMRYEDSLIHFDEALSVKPDFPDALCNRASALYHLGSLEEALKCFDVALTIDPRHATSWNNRGHTLGAMGRLTDAMECYQRALAIQPDLYDARDALAELQDAAGQSRRENQRRT